MIDIASESGADAVKFQIYKAEKLYQKTDPLYNILKNSELPLKWIPELMKYSAKKDLIFLASPFDEDATDLLYNAGVEAFKIGSSESTNLPLLKYTASKKKPMIIATGMCDLTDVYEAVEVVVSSGNKELILLHCTSLYPTKSDQVNLLAMDTMKNAFHLPVGYSDHTMGVIIPVLAVGRGACIIEKHFTISRKLKGPDHSYALEPSELKQMVEYIREAEQCLGSPIKKMLPDEAKIGRRVSIIAKKNIPKGTKITKEMIIIKRPGSGIKPRFLDMVLGKKTKKTIKKDDPITWDLI